jgi:hypothetical protein
LAALQLAPYSKSSIYRKLASTKSQTIQSKGKVVKVWDILALAVISSCLTATIIFIYDPTLFIRTMQAVQDKMALTCLWLFSKFKR